MTSIFREQMHRPLPAGKLPNEMLGRILDQFDFEDPSVIVNPGIGEDIAAIDVQREEILVLKSDPITFATDSIGQYAVLVNANDIATSGATPRWLLTTMLFPCGITPAEIQSLVRELQDFCRQWHITLCGGHTEITDAVTRPVIVGMMAGTVRRADLIEKCNVRVGDRVLLTKAVAVEGTAIIAREFHRRLRRAGMDERDIATCRNFLERISIIPEARLAARNPGTSAMHDVTEGGLATALEELSIACGMRLHVYADRIPVYPETRRIGQILGIDPLGLIGSGSLLICCAAESSAALRETILAAGIEVAEIGEVRAGRSGIEAEDTDGAAAWPHFEVDEITRLF
jgi:hydrogenase maturation factor